MDDAEGTGVWTGDPTWAQTQDDAHSATTSWTDSPAGFYANDTNSSLTLASPLDLSSASAPTLTFWHHYRFEPGFDFGYVEVSTAGVDGPWTTLATYSGTVTDPAGDVVAPASAKGEAAQAASVVPEPWVVEQIDLSSLIGELTVLVRFRVVTDADVTDDGWFLDDISIAELPDAVTLSSTGVTKTTADLSWTSSGAGDFSIYSIHRSDEVGVTANDHLVTEIANQATTTATDTGLTAKTVFYYKAFVVTTAGVYRASNEISVTTAAGLDYPFTDDMEASGANWLAQPSTGWTRVSVPDAHSATNVWSDSPLGNYADNVDNALVLANELPYTGKGTLVFWHKLDLADANDVARVEASYDNGGAWEEVSSFAGGGVSSLAFGPAWSRMQIPLQNGVTSTTGVLVRFRLTSDGSGNADGWVIDDVTVSDAPDAVVLDPPVAQAPPDQDQIDLSWSQNNDIGFAAYEIRRSTSPGVTADSELVTSIADRTTTAYVDAGLPGDVTFYYNVFVLSTFGVRTPSNEGSATTQLVGPVPYPYADDMESGTKAWQPGGTWAQTNSFSHTSSTSWHDSPGLNYPPSSNTSLQLSINLAGAQMPVLEFWHRYSIVENDDYGYVEVSTNGGGSWNMVYFVTGSSSAWIRELVDLTEYAGNADVRIRFRLQTDADQEADGWYVDDVVISETTHAVIQYPFFDDLEPEAGGASQGVGAQAVGPQGGNWITGSWDIGTQGHTGSASLTDSPNGNYRPWVNTHQRIISAAVIDLSGAEHPQLGFWHKYNLVFGDYSHDDEIDRGRVYVSKSFGGSGSWEQVATYNGVQNEWTQVQIDLTEFKGFGTVRVMFTITDDGGNQCCWVQPNSQADGWHIDDIRLKEAPVDVTLNAAADVTMHGARLTWSQNTDPDFAQYEIYRRKDNDPTFSHELIATIVDPNTTEFIDTYTVLQPQRYRYRIYVRNTLGWRSLGSNAVEAVYSVPQVAAPFFEDFESGTGNWDWGHPWGAVNTTWYSTGTSMTDSPLGAYEDNANTSLDTNVSLVALEAPVLTFWHRVGMEQTADRGLVEVSTDGGDTWTTIATFTGTGDWTYERIDLNAYRGAVIGLRFRVLADGQNPADGWYLDDIRIDNGPLAVGYPYSDDFESGVGAWFYDHSWGITDTSSNSASHSLTDSPGTDYAVNTDSSAYLRTNLSGALMPVLKIMHRYSFQENSDFGYIEISIDRGATWRRIYFVTGSSTTFIEELIDLTEFAGQADVLIRFRTVTDAATTADGWYVDDISLDETTHAQLQYPCFDDLEAEAGGAALGDVGAQAAGPQGGNWITGSWGIGGPGHSGSGNLHDSLNGNYRPGTGTDMRLMMANTIDLTNATHPQLTFWHKFALVFGDWSHGDEVDRGRVYVSNFFGKTGTWQQVATFNGSLNEWEQVQIDLSEFAGFDNVRMMFTITDTAGTQCCWSNPNTQADGWYLDDFRINEAPTDVLLAEPTSVTMHGATISWSQNNDPDFKHYLLYRRKDNDPTAADELVTTIPFQTTTSFMDVYTVIQPQRYRYRMYVVNQLDWLSLGSNPVEAVYVVPQVAFPLFENFESGGGNWDWGAPWGLVTTTSYSPSTSMTDSPLGSYDENANTSLDTFVSLVGSNSPVLSFWQKQSLEPGADFGYVEVSTDGGTTWSNIWTSTGIQDWNQERINLNAYAGQVIGLRFRVVTNGSGPGDGWHIDNVTIENSPVSAPYPFADDMESGIAPWWYTDPWGQTTVEANSGSTSWTDSPNSDYANNANTSLRLDIDLTGALMPVLKFAHRYSFESNVDFGYIEVSTDGGASWNPVYSLTGGNPTWSDVLIDLTEYAGRAQASIRWRISSNGGGTADGWYIDDVVIGETTHPPIAYPLLSDFEASDVDWLKGPWGRVGSGFDSTFAIHDSPIGNYRPWTDTHQRLILASTIDLSGATDPQLSFDHRHDFIDVSYSHNAEIDRGRVYVSNFFGKAQTWQQVATFRNSSDWTRTEIDLSAFVGFTNVRVMFVITDDAGTSCCWSNPNAQADGWFLDNIRIDEVDDVAPDAVADLRLVGGEAGALEVGVTANGSTADLRWTAPGDDANTGQAKVYDLRYLKDTPLTEENWDTATPATGEPIPSPAGAIEDFTLAGLDVDSVYHLGLKVIDEVGNASALSNVIQISTFAANLAKVTINAPTEALTSTPTTTSMFEVRLDIENVQNMNSASYSISFNPAVLAITDVLPGMINGTAIPVGPGEWNETPAGTVNVAQTLSGLSTVSGTGYLAVLKFNVVGAVDATTDLTASETALSDELSQPIPSAWASDSVKLVNVLSGDANGDGMVNALDVIKIKRIIVKLDPATPGADANHDGNRNALDLTKTKRIIVGLD